MNRDKINGLKELQDFGLGDPDIKIAVLDGPVDLKHSCFNTHNGQLVPILDSQVNPSSKGRLAINHGTAVTSLIFGKHDSDVDGVAPGCSSILIPIYQDLANGGFSSATQVNLARAITLAIEKGADIINISGGQLSSSGEAEIFLKKAINDCHKAGVLIIAAAGNDGCRCLHVPAADQKVLAVGSTDESGDPTNMTNFGDQYLSNGILALGKNLKAAAPDEGFILTGGGTSFATPVVTGVVALLMSLQKKQGITPNPYVIKSILEQTATPCNTNSTKACKRFLRGTLNIPAAMEMISKNPGVMASGLDFIKCENKEKMEKETLKDTKPIAEEKNAAEVNPSCCSAPQPEEKTSDDELENNAIQAQSDDMTLKPSHDELNSQDIKSTEPKEEDVIPSSNIIPSTNINNQTQEKMENKSTFENSILPTTENVLSPSGEIDPSCGCDGNGEKASIVYALGTLDYDFGSESHKDSFLQSMGPLDPKKTFTASLIEYLKKHPYNIEELIWTLNIDLTPIYSLIPHGSHAAYGYDRLLQILENQENGKIQRISVPGVSKGSTTLLNGSKVTNLFPRLRGMYDWTTEALVSASTSGTKGSSKALAENVTSFLNRIYYKMRNLGVSSEERALNYAATDAFQVSTVFAQALKENLELNDISATKSPICRPGSDCYDVVLSFFNPKERLTQARKEFRFTIDVSDIVPVTVGEVRSWSVY